MNFLSFILAIKFRFQGFILILMILGVDSVYGFWFADFGVFFQPEEARFMINIWHLMISQFLCWVLLSSIRFLFK